MDNLKKYTFKVYYFDSKTKEIKLTAKVKTKPVTKDNLQKLINLELHKYKDSCFELL